MLGGAVPFGYGQEEGKPLEHPQYLEDLLLPCFLLVTRPLTQWLCFAHSDSV